MRQFHKGQRLIVLCNQKTRNTQQVLSRHMRQQQILIEEIQQREIELRTLDSAIVSQQLNDIATTKTEIYIQRRQQAVLLHQRQQLRLEHTMLSEDLHDIEKEILQCQLQLATLKRKEIKFTKWTKSAKKDWFLQKETTNEHEQEESIPWRFQFG